LNNYFSEVTALLIALSLVSMQMPHAFGTELQWSTAFEGLNSSTDGPFKLISIKMLSFVLLLVT
jgi:hypothetical protein